MKKMAAFLLTLFMTVFLAACSKDSESTETSLPDEEGSISDETSAPESSESESVSENENVQTSETKEAALEVETQNDTGAEKIKVLVAYFSATGTTEGMAEYVADALDAELYEIVPENPYTDADLNYNDNNSRSTIEMNDPSARPAISGLVENMNQYDIVFIGYPIWWGDAPRIVNTFMESYDFSGKTMVPFCTSGGSGIGSSADNLEQLTSGAELIAGKRLDGNSSREEIVEWVNGLGLDVTAE